MDNKFVGWVSDSSGRSTMDLIWSCVFVVFLSTWTTLHNNIPPVDKSNLWRMGNKLLLMMVGLLAPEYVATIAFTDLRNALVVRSHMHALGYPEWTLAHSFFVGMGGYMIRVEGVHKPISAENFIKWQRDGTILVARSPDTIADGESNGHHISKKGAVTVELTAIPKLAQASPIITVADGEPRSPSPSPSPPASSPPLEIPWVSTEDIKARSKADFFLKGIACTQIGWLLVQYVARRAQALPTSALEALTVAYVVCALFAYCAWWNKPYDLESPTAIEVPAEHAVAVFLRHAPGQIPMNEDPDLPLLHSVLWTYIVPCVAAVLSFSCLHFLAWDDQFNSVTEEWLWRSSSIFFVWFHVVFLGFAAHMEKNMRKPPTAANIAKIGNCAEIKAVWYILHAVDCITFRRWKALARLNAALLKKCDPECTPEAPLIIFFCSHTLLYFFGRFFVLIEAFACLRRVPAGMYDSVNWAQFIPHLH